MPKTVNIPHELHARAKLTAVREGRKLGALVTEAVELYLEALEELDLPVAADEDVQEVSNAHAP